ncbi:MAG: RagB/SusD family nutrient uptake outer membrane protein [Odoribacter sp.]
MKKGIFKNCCLAVSLLLLSSCNDWLTIQPKNDVARDKMFESEQGFLDGISGAYILIREENYGMVGDMNLKAIEHLANLWTYGNKSDEEELSQHRYLKESVDKRLGGIFKSQYKVLANLNSMAEFFDVQSCLSEQNYNLLKGETFGLRAFLHFDLIRLWGPMPTEINQTKLYLPYETSFTHKKYVYSNYPQYMKLLQEDLNTAEECLQKSDPILTSPLDSLANGKEMDYIPAWGYYRQYKFNYYAVLALQARVKLWMGDKTEALRYAQMVAKAEDVNGKRIFPLTTITSDAIILAGNTQVEGGDVRALYPEHIFAMQMILPNYAIDQMWGTRENAYHITKAQKNDIYGSDTVDIRGRFWHEDKGGRLNTVIPMKFDSYGLRSLPLIRVAEMYLIIMECAPIEEAKAAYLELYTQRHPGNMDFVKEFTEQNRMSIVQEEYYKELCVEGQLFYMNKRLGNEYIKWCNSPCGQTQYILPLPQAEKDY